MAKKSLMVKAARTPKFKVRAYNRCPLCGRPRAFLRRFGMCRICLRDLALQGADPGRDEGQLVRGKPAMSMTDPIADLLTRIRNARGCRSRHGRHPVVAAQGAHGADPREEGYIKSHQA